MKYTYHIINPKNKTSHIHRTHSNIDGCMDELMSQLFNILGDGDGENGGKGSLWRCAGEIYDTIKGGKIYCYGDCKFWMEEEKDEEGNEYVFRISAIVDNVLHIYAKNREDAISEFEICKEYFASDLKKHILKTSSGWGYDGRIHNDGCEEI